MMLLISVLLVGLFVVGLVAEKKSSLQAQEEFIPIRIDETNVLNKKIFRS